VAVRFLFQSFHDVLETFKISRSHALSDPSFEIGQVTADAFRQGSPFRCQADKESAPISRSDFAINQAAISKSIEYAG
jgi:hypothetical protein